MSSMATAQSKASLSTAGTRTPKSKKIKKSKSRYTTKKRKSSRQNANSEDTTSHVPWKDSKTTIHAATSSSRLSTAVRVSRRIRDTLKSEASSSLASDKFARFVSDEKSRVFRQHVQEAVKLGKIFTLDGGPNAIREALQKRGWVEKSSVLKNLGNMTYDMGMPGKIDNSRVTTANADAVWAHKVLFKVAPNFIWTSQNRNLISWGLLNEHQVINLHPKAPFNTKVGLAACLRNSHWVSEAGVAYTLYPRCYRLVDKEQRRVFISDYRLTATIGLLQYVVGTYEQHGAIALLDPKGKVPLGCVDFAIKHVRKYVKIRMHEDLDKPVSESEGPEKWYDFLMHYYGIVLYKEKMVPGRDGDIDKRMYEAAKNALQSVAPFWRTLSVDGTSNVWICKPGAKSRGQGIVLKNKLDSLVKLISKPVSGFAEDWVVQKYIERPLLIYGTKFDIRQWFVVSNWNPLTVWVYRECYLRFCSNPFTIEEMHESIHLCNFAVQHRYKNSKFRDPALPKNNMWDSYTFQAYLRTIGKMNQWNTVVYPGIKKSILGVLLAANEDVEIRHNCFELYGADFLLSEDLTPWLLEINSGPSLAPSTSVTSRMVHHCLEDCVKVIIDQRTNPNANTGMFECVYKQLRLPEPQERYIEKLYIQGRRIGPDTRSRSKGLRAMTTVNLKQIKPLETLTNLNSNSAPFLDANDKEVDRKSLRPAVSSPSTVSGSLRTLKKLKGRSILQLSEIQVHSGSGGEISANEEEEEDLKPKLSNVADASSELTAKGRIFSRQKLDSGEVKAYVGEQSLQEIIMAGRKRSTMENIGLGENRSAVFGTTPAPPPTVTKKVKEKKSKLTTKSVKKKLSKLPLLSAKLGKTPDKEEKENKVPSKSAKIEKLSVRIRPSTPTEERRASDDHVGTSKLQMNIVPIKQRPSPILDGSETNSIASLFRISKTSKRSRLKGRAKETVSVSVKEN